MYNLIFIFASHLSSGMQPAYIGEYANLESCQSAIREIYTTQINPPGKRLQETEKAIDMAINFQKSFVCIPKKKG